MVAKRKPVDQFQNEPSDANLPDSLVRSLAFKNVEIGIWQLAVATNDIHLDATAAQIVGWAERGCSGKFGDLIDRVHPDDRQELSLRIELCACSGVPTTISFRLEGPWGKTRWLQLTASRTRATTGGIVSFGTVRDVTKEKLLSKELRDSQFGLEAVVKQSMVGVLHIDRNRNVLMVNDRFLAMVGRTREELNGLSFVDYTHPDDLEWNAPLSREKREKCEPFAVEKRYLRPDGSEVWCAVHVSFVADTDELWSSAIVFAHEITDRKRAELEQARSRDMLQLALDGAGAGIWEVRFDGERGLNLDANAVRLHGLPAGHSGQLSFEEWSKLLGPENTELMVRTVDECAASGQTIDVEFALTRPDGEERWMRTHGRTMLDKNGEPEKIVGLVIDDTARKRARDKLRNNEMALRISQEAGRIGTFVADQKGLTHASSQYFEILGLPEGLQDSGPMDWTNTIHPDDLVRIMDEIAEADRKLQTYQETEYRIVRANDGEVRWIHARLTCERGDDGEMLRVAGALLDVTDSKLTAEQLRHTVNLKNGIIASSADCIKVLDLDGTLRFMSPKGLETMEVSDGDALLGKRWQDLWPEEVRPVVEEALKRASLGKIGRFDAGLVTARGNAKWADVVVTPLTNDSGEVTQLLSITRDITELREKTEQVRWAAEHDALTGLPNRNCFDQCLDRTLAAAERTGEIIGILALDVDNFKFVNDAFGHDAGDALLRSISQRLKKAILKDDFVARIGGDEFAIVVRHLEDGRDILEMGISIDAIMKEPVLYKENLLDCRVSIGAATSPEHGTRRDEFLKSADIALYAAKSSGPNHVLMYDVSQRSELDRRSTMIGMARTALDQDNIVPFYQPKLCLRTGQIAGFEALLRWRDSSGCIGMPGDIDAAFEDFELAHMISEKMQDCVIRDLKGWLEDGVDVGHVAINLAAAEFGRDNIAGRLLKKLETAGVASRHLQVEVTETVFLGRGADHVRQALLQLKARGVEIALDDFGTGFASLTHLKEFPVDVIKIDRSFIADLGINSGDTAIVCALIGLARELGMTTVAEGIESVAQRDILQGEGCDFGQGYLFGKAVSCERVPGLLGAERKVAAAHPYRRDKTGLATHFPAPI